MTDHGTINLDKAEAGAQAPASFGISPNPERGTGRLGAFALGVAAGVIGLAITAMLVVEDAPDDDESDETGDEAE